jgi:hypothetical protein
MRKPADVEDMAQRLRLASSAPLVPSQDNAPEQPKPKPAKKAASKALFLRVPGPLYARYEAEAMKRTKQSGKGVTIQQVMLETLEASR